MKKISSSKIRHIGEMLFKKFTIILLICTLKCLIDAPSVFCMDEFNATIVEEAEIGSEIFDLKKELLKKKFDKSEKLSKIDTSKKSFLLPYSHERRDNPREKELDTHITDLTFSFLDSSKHSNEYFTINPHNNMLAIGKRIDRDTLCENKFIKTCNCQASCIFKLDILASGLLTTSKPSNIFYHIFSLYIHVLDMNDNAPRFARNEFTIEIPENVPKEHRIPIPIAYDADSGANGVKKYQLQFLNTKEKSLNSFRNNTNEVDNLFSIDYSNLKSIYLKVNAHLDRELNASYQLQIYAIDGGEPPLVGKADLTIKVLDQNDNSPKFTIESYRFNISESTPVGTRLVTLKAVDPDEGVNGQIEYHLSTLEHSRNKISKASKGNYSDFEAPVSRDANYFAIDPKTGELYVHESLDFEKQSYFKLVISAQDKGVPSSFSANPCVIEVYLFDENDNAPEIRIVTAEQHNNKLKMKENSDEMAKDNDAIRTLYIDESATNGTFLCLVSISDADSGDNAKLEWSFHVQPDDGSIKELAILNDMHFNNLLRDENGGRKTPRHPQQAAVSSDNSVSKTFALAIAKNLDRETQASYEIEIIAKDFGKPRRLESKLHLRIILMDVNDNKPKFLPQNDDEKRGFKTKLLSSSESVDDSRVRYEFRLSENNAINTLIGCIQCSDADENENARVRFSLQGEANIKDLISINSDGCLYAISSFDREMQSSYIFEIFATDAGMPALNSSARVALFIDDINDHVPYFSQSKYSFSVKENAKFGTIVGKIMAFDLDEGDNSRLEFQMMPADKYSSNLFQINIYNGYVLLNAESLDADNSETKREYNYIVYVSDKGMPSFGTSCNVKISILDVNDNCPLFRVEKSGNLIKTLPESYSDDNPLYAVLYFMSLDPLVMKFSQQQIIVTKLQLIDRDRDEANNKVVVRNVSVSKYDFDRNYQIMSSDDADIVDMLSLSADGSLSILVKNFKNDDDYGLSIMQALSGVYVVKFEIADSAQCVVSDNYIVLVLQENYENNDEKIDSATIFMKSLKRGDGRSENNLAKSLNSRNSGLSFHLKQLFAGSGANSIILVVCFVAICLVIMLLLVLCTYCLIKYRTPAYTKYEKSPKLINGTMNSDLEIMAHGNDYTERTKILNRSPLREATITKFDKNCSQMLSKNRDFDELCNLFDGERAPMKITFNSSIESAISSASSTPITTSTIASISNKKKSAFV